MLTRFLAKLMGLSLVLVVLGMIINKPATVATMSALFTDPALMFITGAFTMIVGLAVVLGHNRWSGGPLPVIVTLYGWLALIKGALFIWLPPPNQAILYQAMHFEQYFYGYFVCALVIGCYLTVAGFTTSPVQDRP